MAWYDAGSGAGAWDAAPLSPSLKNILHELCTAINEREMFRASNSANVSSITRSSTTATATTSSAHGLATGDKVYMVGADQSEYNGVVPVTVTGSTTFTYTVSGSPATPATGTLRCRRPYTKFVYNDAGDTKYFPAVSDFEGLPLSKIASGPERTVTELSRVGTTVTAKLLGHGFADGDVVTISGASPSDYNGAHTITNAQVIDGLSSCSVVSITRSGGNATVTFDEAHGMAVGDLFDVSGATQTEYNGLQTVLTVPGSTSITYTVSGTPATPATGTPVVTDLSRFQFEISGAPATPATGTIKAVANRHMVTYATRSGSTATFYCYDHGFATGDYVETLGSGATADGWAFYGPVTVTGTHTFTATITGTPTSPWVPGTAGTICVTREGEFRKLLRQLQGAIAGLLTASTSAGVIRFVEDSAPYETNYTLANLLGAGSYGSSWVSLSKLSRASLADVLDQMREAVDLLVVATVTGTAAFSSGDLNTSYYRPNQADGYNYMFGFTGTRSGTTVTLEFVEDHLLEIGDTIFVDAYMSGLAPPIYDSEYWATVTVSAVPSSTSIEFEDPGSTPHFFITIAGPPYYGSDWYTLKRGYGGVTKENAWGCAVGAAPKHTLSSTSHISLRQCASVYTNNGAHDYGAYDYDVGGEILQHFVRVAYDVSCVFVNTPLLGTLVVGEIYLLQSNNGDVTQDAYVLTDSDADDVDIDATIGTTDSLITVSKTSAFFDAASKTLTFTTPTPASHPFSTALGDNETTERYVTVRESNASKHTRELVPGTHLTYG